MGPFVALWTQSFVRGLRLLKQDAVFTALAVCLLAAGQAASIAVLTAFDAVVLRPIPYPEPDRLAFVWSTRTTQNQGVLLSNDAIPDLRAWQSRARSVAVGGFIYTEYSVGGSKLDPEIAQGARVTTDLFDVMEVRPAIGRAFRTDESQFGQHHVAIISHEYWERRFDGAQDVLGRTILIDGEPHTIVGVMPAGMPFMDNVPVVHVWTPLAFLPSDPLGTRAQRPLIVLARLKEGFTLEQAQTELSAIGQRLEIEDPANAGIGVRVNSAREQTISYSQGTLVMLLGAVALLLLTACLNAAGLLLTRTVARRAEFGLRASLGASRTQLVTQVLAESLPVSVLSALLAIPLALMMVNGIGSQLPWMLPRHNAMVLNGRIVLIVVAVWIALTIGLAIPPALHACRVDLIEALGGHTRAGGLRLPSVGVRKLLMSCQIALAVALLLGAGLLARTASALHRVPLGFSVDRVLTFRIPFPQLKYPLPLPQPQSQPRNSSAPQALAAADAMLEKMRTVPGVKTAGLGSLLPLSFGSSWVRRIAPGASSTVPFSSISQLPTGKVAFVGPGFFEALGVTLRDGRFFSERDTAAAEAVAIVNASFVRSILARSQAVSEHVLIVRPSDAIGIATAPASPDVRTIVGTIGNIRDSHVEREPEPEIYVPLAQFNGEGWSNTLTVAVETTATMIGTPTDVVAALRERVLSVDPDQPISQIATTSDLLERRLARSRFSVRIVTAVAALAIACVSLGIFGVFAYVARLRATEFAVRLAVGARPAQIAWSVLAEALWLAAFGLAAGLGVMLLFVPLLRSELYGVTSLDASTIAMTTAVIILVTLASILVPARYAARLDATACLR
jgi:putative ABC transport system permease protein